MIKMEKVKKRNHKLTAKKSAIKSIIQNGGEQREKSGGGRMKHPVEKLATVSTGGKKRKRADVDKPNAKRSRRADVSVGAKSRKNVVKQKQVVGLKSGNQKSVRMAVKQRELRNKYKHLAKQKPIVTKPIAAGTATQNARVCLDDSGLDRDVKGDKLNSESTPSPDVKAEKSVVKRTLEKNNAFSKSYSKKKMKMKMKMKKSSTATKTTGQNSTAKRVEVVKSRSGPSRQSGGESGVVASKRKKDVKEKDFGGEKAKAVKWKGGSSLRRAVKSCHLTGSVEKGTENISESSADVAASNDVKIRALQNEASEMNDGESRKRVWLQKRIRKCRHNKFKPCESAAPVDSETKIRDTSNPVKRVDSGKETRRTFDVDKLRDIFRSEAKRKDAVAATDSAPETAIRVAPPGVSRKKQGAKPLGSLRERMEEKRKRKCRHKFKPCESAGPVDSVTKIQDPSNPVERVVSGKETRRTFDVDKLRDILRSEAKRKDKEETAAAVTAAVAAAAKDSAPDETALTVAPPGVGRKKRGAKPLGSLRERMEEKLQAARFRYINEQLYTRSGSEAVTLFRDDPEAFDVYHRGFAFQVAKWPVNPVDRVIQYISEKSSDLVVADFGCGEAKLALEVENKVHSFDLIALNDRVTVCDISEVPLESDSVDVGVFCLSLMGTDLVNFLCEANRVLRTNGTLLVAEVTSRFDKIGRFVRRLRKLGFSLETKDTSNDMFIWLEFLKTGVPSSNGSLPTIELAACSYKKR